MNKKKKISGYRGYIFTNKIAGNFIPQRVQNLVIKDYCERKNLFFKLSITEFNIGYFKALKKSLKNLNKFDQGIIFYSISCFQITESLDLKFMIELSKIKKFYILL